MSRQPKRPRISARAKRKQEQVAAAQKKWETEQLQKELAAQRRRATDLESSNLDKLFNDILNNPMSGRAFIAGHELTPLGTLASLVIPLSALRSAITIARRRMAEKWSGPLAEPTVWENMKAKERDR